MVRVSFAHEAVTPVGKPVAVPMSDAPVVVCVMFVNAVLIQTVGVEDAAPAVITGDTIIVPVAFTLPHPSVNGIL